MTYYNNKAAVLVEENKLDEAEKLLNDAIEKRYDMGRECKVYTTKCLLILTRLFCVSQS